MPIGKCGFLPAASLSLIRHVKFRAAFTVFLPLLTGCVTTPPRDILATPAQTVIATGFEPIVRGINVGTTVFQNRDWEATPEAFNANEAATGFITKALLQPLPVIDGRTIGLALRQSDGFANAHQAELVDRLSELGRRQNADRIVLLTTGRSSDWIAGTNQSLNGLGLYRRELFGMKRLQVYGVFQLRVFDCRTGAFTASDTLPGAREVHSVAWHESWAEFSAAEQRQVIAAWTELLKEQSAQLLSRAGLANAPQPAERSVAELLLFRPNRPKSWLPEGNVLPIPAGVTGEQAHRAVVHGLKARGWTLVSESETQVIGLYRNGRKEAGVSAVISTSEIQLIANDYEFKPDGSRVSVKPHARWQNNLKASIYEALLNTVEADAPAIPKA